MIRHQHTYGFGVHRFDVDESYAYMSTEAEGFVGNILVISPPLVLDEADCDTIIGILYDAISAFYRELK